MIKLDWNTFKAFINARSLSYSAISHPDGYFVQSTDDLLQIETFVLTGTASYTEFTTIYLAGANTSSRTSKVLQPISAASLPLPTGAATSDNQATQIAQLARLTPGNKLRYVDMGVASGGVAREAAITDAAWTTVFSYTGSGLVFGFSLGLESGNDKWLVRILCDGYDILPTAGLNSNDMNSASVYNLGAFEGVGVNMIQTGSGLKWSSPNNLGLLYTTSFSIQVRRVTGGGSKKFRAGLIALTKET